MFLRALELCERLSASTPLATLFHSDPEAFNLFRCFLELPPAEVARLRQQPYPSIVDQPAELTILMAQLSLWATPTPDVCSSASEDSYSSFEGIKLFDDEAVEVAEEDVEQEEREADEEDNDDGVDNDDDGEDEDDRPTPRRRVNFTRLKRYATGDPSTSTKAIKKPRFN